jgi:thioredoxin reductase/Pyruvate/2-oxoacid:ferredoxin oxidoreductase delta subunit
VSWALLLGVCLTCGLGLLAVLSRRAEFRRMRATLAARERATRSGAATAKLQHPVVDLSRCLGCATCVAVCPEDGVLDMVHGQASVVNGARCQGIAACERECPAGAITVTLTDLAERRDVPVLSEDLEAVGCEGLFLAGEVTAHALIRVAVEQGSAVARTIAARVRRAGKAADRNGPLDLCIVGAGPAGLACALEATRLGLRFQLLEQEADIGGTVARYPRRKLVLTEPIDLPLVGRLRRRSYEKEELVALWQDAAARHALPVVTGAALEAVERRADHFVVTAGGRQVAARQVCLALGRRGTPRRLGVRGEDLPKVAYALLDAASYEGRRILVVGGGDSAVEAALGLAEQPGNRVTLSYRRPELVRIRSRNQERLEAAVAAGRIDLRAPTTVRAIEADQVELVAVGADGAPRVDRLPNDEVFVMAGGVPPFELLERAGVSFDPRQRPAGAAAVPAEQGSGLLRALALGFGLALLALGWAFWHRDYYGLPIPERPAHDKHAWLRPGLGLGLGLGIASVLLIAANLLYLLRRAPNLPLRWGSLRAWMQAHVATGILAFLCAALHAAMSPRDTPGGNAFWALAILLLTGAIGRYLYAYVPRAANGRELALAEVRSRLDQLGTATDGTGFATRARARVEALVEGRQWRGSFVGRLLALAGVRWDLRRALRELDLEGRTTGVPAEELRTARTLAREAHRHALAVAHYEDLRAVLGAWRYLHRWVAVLMVVLVLVHVVYALAYGAHLFERGGAS